MKFFFSCIAAVALASCVGGGSLPNPGSSKYLQSTGGGLSIEGETNNRPFAFGAGLKLLPGAPAPAYATVRFENPENPSAPFVSKHTFSKPGDEIAISTPSFGRVTNSRNYTFSVDLFSDSARQNKIDYFTQQLRVDIPPILIQAKGLQNKVN